jgi:hypothetical protein
VHRSLRNPERRRRGSLAPRASPRNGHLPRSSLGRTHTVCPGLRGGRPYRYPTSVLRPTTRWPWRVHLAGERSPPTPWSGSDRSSPHTAKRASPLAHLIRRWPISLLERLGRPPRPGPQGRPADWGKEAVLPWSSAAQEPRSRIAIAASFRDSRMRVPVVSPWGKGRTFDADPGGTHPE